MALSVALSVALSAVLLIPSGQLLAQQLRGTVLFADSVTPARAVLVQLTDSTGEVVGRTLTGATGAFAITAPGEGRFGLRILRIGFRPHEVPPRPLRTGTAPSLTIVLRSAAVTLPTVAIRGERSCRERPDAAVAVFAVWEEARKALQSAEAATALGALTTEFVSYRRRVLMDSGNVHDEVVEQHRERNARPFTSAPPDTLALRGYRRRVGDKDNYDGPDGAVLLSDSFLATHCFRLRQPQLGGGSVEPGRADDVDEARALARGFELDADRARARRQRRTQPKAVGREE